MEVSIPVNLVFNFSQNTAKLEGIDLGMNPESQAAIVALISQRMNSHSKGKVPLDKSVDNDVPEIHSQRSVSGTGSYSSSQKISSMGKNYWAGKKERNECARRCTKKCVANSSYCSVHKRMQSLAIKAGLTKSA